jgi:CDP-diacylglycerol--glycerol-3-phosphate 3-phosphatidyltransferase
MNLADRLTSLRLFLAPIFFIVFLWGGALGQVSAVILLWALFVAMELSDLLDGKAARKQGTVSAFGKLFDPFADVIERMTYFVCFAFSGIMPLWALLLILYREFAQLFLRMVLSGRGIAMGARPGGKLKAVFYMLAGASSLLLDSFVRLGLAETAFPTMRTMIFILYVLAVALSLGSFVDYFLQFRKLTAGAER